MRPFKHILAVLAFGCGLFGSAFGQQSVLSSGDWYKLTIDKEGVYKIDYNLLKKIGINPAKIDPRKIRIYGNGGGMLPQPNNTSRATDLLENSILVNGEADGRFDKQDFILFYGEGPDRVKFNSQKNIFYYEHNLYSDRNFYFLTIADNDGKRITAADDLGSGYPVIREFNDYFFYEKDQYNELHSGREWFGEKFGVSTNEHAIPFTADGIVPGSQIRVVSDIVGQSHATASFKLLFNNIVIGEHPVVPIPNSRYGVKGVHQRDTFLINESTPGAAGKSAQEIKYQFQKATGFSQGYLDYFLISCERNLALYNNQTIFTSGKSINNPTSQFEISSLSSQPSIWDITDPLNVKTQNFTFGSSAATFSTSTNELKKFIVFNNAIPAPVFDGKIPNQNLHGMAAANLIIVTHPSFRQQADRLAAHRNTFSNWSVIVVTADEIYNEFSSGRQDVTAIRDFTKYLYDKNPGTVKALLLFGRGSYDFKNRLPNNTNFVITYESRNSLHPLQTYSSDDYFAFLENSEGNWSESPVQNQTLDIGVGRLPVTTTEEAGSTVDKIIGYDTNQKNFGYWRKKFVFVADDGSGDDGYTSLHQYQSDQLAQFVEQKNYGVDTRKLFIGSYPKIVQPNGEHIPSFTDDIVRAFESGSLIINYTGHGSEKQWADENVFNNNTISKLENTILPFLVTATCEFGRQDDPAEISSAELSVKLKDAGAIGMVTTARPVNATTNFNLNQAFYDALFQREGGSYLSMGEVFRRTKNNSISGVSNRNFSLLGDPSLTLALPVNSVHLSEIKTVTGSDTLKALSTVVAKGEIRNFNNEKLTTFNGTLEATLFDKETNFVTIGRNNPPFSYKQWNNALFRGKASVTAGDFELRFIVPKNIAYQIADGKFSLYAADPKKFQDASGAFKDFKIGGSENIVSSDNTSPELTLFIGDTTFVNGGITSPNTLLLVRLEDFSGINISGYGIGNSLLAVLDDDAQTFVLNDYYVADTDQYSSGWIHFPIKDLSPGKHTLTVSAWDVYNNAVQSKIDFVVTDGEALVVGSFGNYPNPFRDKTTLFFTHNRSGDDLQAQVFIQNTTGEVVKTAEFEISASDYMVNLMELNALLNDKKLSAGLYLARLIVRSLTNGSKNEQVTKLIILN